MDTPLYKEFLVEEEKFLKVLERNLKDQINRLKVEELSILKLISNSDPSQYGNTTLTDHELLPNDTPLFPRDSTDAAEVSASEELVAKRQGEGQDTASLLPTPPTRTEMSSQEFPEQTTDNYVAFSAHSNPSSPQESNSGNTPVNRLEGTSTELNLTGELSRSTSELNNSGTPTGPTDVMTPVHSRVSSRDIVSTLGETMRTHPIENTFGINSRDKVTGHSGDTNHMDLSVNAIPLNLDLVERFHANEVDEIEEIEEIDDDIEEIEEIDDDDDENYVYDEERGEFG